MAVMRVTHPDVPEPPSETWSNCLIVGNQIFVAGMTARNDAQILADDEYGQARAIFDKIAKLLEAADASMADVVKVVIYVTDILPTRGGVARPPRVLQRRFPGFDSCGGQRACNAGTQGRDRGDRRPLRVKQEFAIRR